MSSCRRSTDCAEHIGTYRGNPVRRRCSAKMRVAVRTVSAAKAKALPVAIGHYDTNVGQPTRGVVDLEGTLTVVSSILDSGSVKLMLDGQWGDIDDAPRTTDARSVPTRKSSVIVEEGQTMVDLTGVESWGIVKWCV